MRNRFGYHCTALCAPGSVYRPADGARAETGLRARRPGVCQAILRQPWRGPAILNLETRDGQGQNPATATALRADFPTWGGESPICANLRS
jgi:hypothetical protein